MHIIDAITDEQLFRPFLADAEGSISSWYPWLTAIRALYGLPIPVKRRELIRQVTGRDPAKLPTAGFNTALFLTGRRSGKSRIAAVIGAFEAALAGHEKKLAKGEMGVVPVFSPTKKQSRIVRQYLRAVFDTPLLQGEVTEETKEGFALRNGNLIEILTGDFRTARGYTLLAAIVDEIAFFGIDDEAKVKSDTELVRAIKPSLATTNGRLIAISSPYARKGWCYKTHSKNFGNDAGRTLVVQCPSRTLNPTLAQRIVDEAIAEDMQAAKSEYLGEFRDDIAAFLPREVIEALVVANRFDLMPNDKRRYVAFVDLSGGRGDDAGLAIAHRAEGKIILDRLRQYKPPFDPRHVIKQMAEELRRFGIRRVTGDNYAADFCAMGFQGEGILYTKSEKAKSALYLELLPILCAGEIELLDNAVLVNQLAGLERRTRSGGKDNIDHSAGQHDDLANVVAGVAVVASQKVLHVGAFGAH